MESAKVIKTAFSDLEHEEISAQLDKNIGIILGHLRRAEDLSIAELANFTGTAEWEIARIEAGKQSPSLAYLMRVANKFSIDAGELISAAKVLVNDKE